MAIWVDLDLALRPAFWGAYDPCLPAIACVTASTMCVPRCRTDRAARRAAAAGISRTARRRTVNPAGATASATASPIPPAA